MRDPDCAYSAPRRRWRVLLLYVDRFGLPDMHVLLIGGTGLISTGITRQLVEAGYEVTCFTRGESEETIPDRVRFITGDRNEPDDLQRAVEAEPDCVIDMVCFSPEQAEAAIDTFGGTIDQFVYCSTVDVYHRPPERNPVTESAEREPAVSEYGEKKAAAEDVFMEADGRAFATTIIRPWHTYGEGGSVLHTLGYGTYFLDRLWEGKPVIVHGDGTSIWAPCHRDDVARAFVAAVGNETAYGEAYHVTSEEHITWNQYYRRVARAIGAPEPDLVHIPTRQLLEILPDRTYPLEAHFQYSSVFDNAKARRDLDYRYTIAFEDGVRRTVERLKADDAIDPWDTEDDDVIIEAWNEALNAFEERVSISQQ